MIFTNYSFNEYLKSTQQQKINTQCIYYYFYSCKGLENTSFNFIPTVFFFSCHCTIKVVHRSFIIFTKITNENNVW